MKPAEPFEKIVLWNNRARGATEARELRDMIAADPRVELVQTVSAEESQQRAQAAVEAGVPMLVAAGGDGSIHTVVQGLVQQGSRTSLGVLPLGTGNDLCRTLRIPLDPWAAWKTLMLGHTRAIDVTRVTSSEGTARYFTNSANGGNSSRVLESLNEEMKHTWGAWAYLRAAVHVLGDMQTYRVRLRLDDQPPSKQTAWNVVLANGRTAGGGVQVAPRASVTDGKLDVVLILDGTPFDLAELATDLLAGDYIEHECVIYHQARSVGLEIEPPTELIVDGEKLPGSRFEFEVLPKALQVVVGEKFIFDD